MRISNLDMILRANNIDMLLLTGTFTQGGLTSRDAGAAIAPSPCVRDHRLLSKGSSASANVTGVED